MDAFTETSTEIARKARVTSATVTKYARAGLLDFQVASDGTRLYRADQAAKVREIYAARMLGRGRRSAA